MNQQHLYGKGCDRMQNVYHQRGQSTIEYTVVCAALAFALFVDLNGDNSALKSILDNLNNAYQKISYALSLPT